MRLVRNNDSLGCALMLDELIVTNPYVQRWWTTGCLWAIARIDAHLAAGEFSQALHLTLNSSPANDVDDGTHNQSYLRAWVLERAALDSGTGQLNPDLDRLISNLPVESALLQGRSEALRVQCCWASEPGSAGEDARPGLALSSARLAQHRDPRLAPPVR